MKMLTYVDGIFLKFLVAMWFMMSFISPYFWGYPSHQFMGLVLTSYGFYFIIINSIFTLNLHIFQHCNQSSGRKIVICTNTHNYRFILYKIYNYENIIISFSPLLQLQWRIKAFRLQKNTKTP